MEGNVGIILIWTYGYFYPCWRDIIAPIYCHNIIKPQVRTFLDAIESPSLSFIIIPTLIIAPYIKDLPEDTGVIPVRNRT